MAGEPKQLAAGASCVIRQHRLEATMRRAWMNAALILVVVSAAAVAAAEDLTIVSKVTPAKGEPSTQTQYITAERMRMSDGLNDTIVDLAGGKLVQIDHKKKSYYETTFEEMQQYFAQLNEMLASTPMMGSMMGKISDVQVQKSAETREIIGHTCTKYVLTMGESFKQTMWVTPDLKIPVSYFDARKMSYAMMGPMAARFEKMLEEMKKIDGFPLAADVDMKMMGMDASSRSEVIELSKGDISADVFAVPAGYKKTKSPMQE
jgi:hypothetical protein